MYPPGERRRRAHPNIKHGLLNPICELAVRRVHSKSKSPVPALAFKNKTPGMAKEKAGDRDSPHPRGPRRLRFSSVGLAPWFPSRRCWQQSVLVSVVIRERAREQRGAHSGQES